MRGGLSLGSSGEEGGLSLGSSGAYHRATLVVKGEAQHRIAEGVHHTCFCLFCVFAHLTSFSPAVFEVDGLAAQFEIKIKRRLKPGTIFRRPSTAA